MAVSKWFSESQSIVFRVNSTYTLQHAFNAIPFLQEMNIHR
jgi:hypothetical protein